MNGMASAQQTTFVKRFGDAMELLCSGKRPPDSMIRDWFDRGMDSFELQEWGVANGPDWAQGIAMIDAATTLAKSPQEGVGHAA